MKGLLGRPGRAVRQFGSFPSWGPEKDTRRRNASGMRVRHLKGLLIVASLLISTAPLYARQQQTVAKLKADAQKVITSISRDKRKIEAYCEVLDLGGQIVEVAQEKDEKKADALMQRTDELEKILGPEDPALFNALYEADPDSEDVQDILAMFAMLDQSCPH
jgi:hypothetical protein